MALKSMTEDVVCSFHAGKGVVCSIVGLF